MKTFLFFSFKTLVPVADFGVPNGNPVFGGVAITYSESVPTVLVTVKLKDQQE